MARIIDRYPLSPMQQGMLFHHLASPRSGVDLEQILCTLNERVDPAAMRRAWERLVSRHPVLRTSFRWEGLEEPIQEVQDRVDLPWEEQDWTRIPAEVREARLTEAVREDRRRGITLHPAPLMRVALYRFADADTRMLWTFHHMLMDGRSFPGVLKELFAFYSAHREGRTVDPPLPPPYRLHVERFRAQDLSAARSFWTGRLAGFTAATPLPAASQAPTAETWLEPRVREIRLPAPTTARLRSLAEAEHLSLNTIVQGAWAHLLRRHSAASDVVFGATRACRRSSVDGADEMVGLFINTLPVRVRADETRTVLESLRDLRASQRDLWRYEQTPLMELQGWSEVAPGTPLFDTLLVFDTFELGALLRDQGGEWAGREFRLIEKTGYPITLYAYDGPELLLRLAVDPTRFEERTAETLLLQLKTVLDSYANDPHRTLGDVETMAPEERERLLNTWNETRVEVSETECVHHLFERQVHLTPDAPALAAGSRSLSYRELNEQADRIAGRLRGLGVGPDVPVGICVDRSAELVAALLGVLKAGGAYVPMDPSFPRDRLAFMLEDSGARVVLTRSHLRPALPAPLPDVVDLDDPGPPPDAGGPDRTATGVRPDHLAYVIYTSGSTGTPKGVMVEHRQVINFFAGMDARVPHDPPGVWLAVTSLSFDISVLELLWTLARGFKVVLAPDQRRPAAPAAPAPVAFSLFYFAADEDSPAPDKYRLLMEGARFADASGFEAVWTPERHFHAFGGLYPNPAVAGAAIASVTRNVRIRAGSVVLPLHHPVRVAEEWSLVDNLSRGRVDISFASGWQPADFVLRPESYADRHETMYREIDTVRRLWRGETVTYPGVDGVSVAVRTRPRPVQEELPVWVTTAGSIRTWRRAGEIGANVLTHLLGQSLEELGERIQAYRDAWREKGHGPGDGHVSLMLHTFVGESVDSVRETVRAPMKRYLGTALSLVRNSASAWSAFKRRRDGTTASADVDPESLTDEERADLLEFSFERYFETSGLFGTPERCVEIVDKLRAVGVNEIACLIDFGVDPEQVLRHLPLLNRVREEVSRRAPGLPSGEAPSPGRLLNDSGATHLQCTPSLATMLLEEPSAREAMKGLRALLIGGEAFPPSLAAELPRVTRAKILNMYGPTETTVWSSVHELRAGDRIVPIGRPIANTRLYIVDDRLRPVPIGAPGELLIGGKGVARGYHRRPDLTSRRFVADPFGGPPGARLYRTGDLARYRPDGTVEFLGRLDHQVKVRGHRVEPGEIEATLSALEAVREAAVVAREDRPGDLRLVAYVVPASGDRLEEADLRRRSREKLPDAMIPSHFVVLERLPRTPNGKLDRKALPPPVAAPTTTTPAASPPADTMERKVAEVWREVLGVASVGLDDNFFDLGGHSLLAVKAHRRLKETFRRNLAITDLFRFPTVRALAGFLGGEEAAPALQQSQARADLRRERMQLRNRRGGSAAESPGGGGSP